VLQFPNGETGSVTVEPDARSVRIDPGAGQGSTTFTYTARDADGGVSTPATVTVDGPRLNTPPFARDQAVAITVGTSRVLELDAGDVDGTPVTVVDLVDTSGLVIERSGLTVTLLATAPGTYVVTYQVDDGEATSRVATITIEAANRSTTTTTTTPATTTTTPSTTTPTTTTTTATTTTTTSP